MTEKESLIRINLDPLEDNKRLILLIENNLTTEENKILNECCNTYTVNMDDKEQFISELPNVDIYIVPIESMLDWYLLNLTDFKNDLCIYYRKVGYIKRCDIPKLDVDYVRKKLITATPKNKEDLFIRLSYNSPPHVQSCCSYCCSCLFSKMTCGQCCSYFCKCIKVIFYFI